MKPIVPKGVFIKKYHMPAASAIGWGVFYENYFLSYATDYGEARDKKKRLENEINLHNGELSNDLCYWKCVYTKTGFWLVKRPSTEYRWK